MSVKNKILIIIVSILIITGIATITISVMPIIGQSRINTKESSEMPTPELDELNDF